MSLNISVLGNTTKVNEIEISSINWKGIVFVLFIGSILITCLLCYCKSNKSNNIVEIEKKLSNNSINLKRATR